MKPDLSDYETVELVHELQRRSLNSLIVLDQDKDLAENNFCWHGDSRTVIGMAELAKMAICANDHNYTMVIK